MGYRILIGEKTFDTDCNRFTALRASMPDAPANELGPINCRAPSYSGWNDFCREAGLEDLFNHLFADHPGCIPLTQEHLNAFEAAIGNVAGYNAERLSWLIYWTRWALANCKEPVIANS